MSIFSPVKVLIIGAGASGLMAAVNAARSGADVRVVEHGPEPGRKLLITGKGKCNFTNSDISPEHYHCSDESFTKSILSRFTYEDSLAFFESLGVKPFFRHYPYDESAYVYPAFGGARAVRDALYEAALDAGARFSFDSSARDFLPGADRVILAAGSNAHPETGSDGSVYPLIKSLGLDFHRFYPALCALYTKDERLSELKGHRVNEEVSLLIDSSEVLSVYGQVQFNTHSISGIPVMQLSRLVAPSLAEGKSCSLLIDGHEYPVHRTAGFDKAQVCSGGVALADIDPETLMAREKNGVYVSGELLDVVGDCGGYNLHFAFATGMIAGRAAAL